MNHLISNMLHRMLCSTKASRWRSAKICMRSWRNFIGDVGMVAVIRHIKQFQKNTRGK